MDKEKILKENWKTMWIYLTLGITIFFAAIFFFIAHSWLPSDITKINSPVTLLSIFLLITTFILSLFWIRASIKELQIFSSYFDDFVSSTPSSSLFISVGIAFFLGALIYFSNDIVIYSWIFAIFTLFGSWGGWIRSCEVRAGLDKAQKKVKEEIDQEHPFISKWSAIESYEFERPHLQRAVTGLFFTFVPLIIGLKSESLSQPTKDSWLSIAYIIIILNIIISEYIIHRWRRERDHVLF